MVPVAALNAKPVGNTGETAKIYGTVPPDAVTGVNATAAVPAVSEL